MIIEEFYFQFFNFQITIEGVRGTNYQGDIAIDDIAFVSASCGCKYIYIYSC